MRMSGLQGGRAPLFEAPPASEAAETAQETPTDNSPATEMAQPVHTGQEECSLPGLPCLSYITRRATKTTASGLPAAQKCLSPIL